MKIEKLEIDNFKSLNGFKLENPNAFSVFVGANGVGKSNIFEALEFLNYKIIYQGSFEQTIQYVEIDGLFGGYKNFVNFKRLKDDLSFSIKFLDLDISNFTRFGYEKQATDVYENSRERRGVASTLGIFKPFNDRSPEVGKEFFAQFIYNFSRIFINASSKKKLNTTSDNKLNLDCSNLEKVLKRLLLDSNIREEIIDWLSLFVPAFKDIEIKSDELSGTDTLLFYEKDSDKPFTKNLISDGTFNILCLLVAVYQSDTPQFICIEEPEIGLNPYVVKELASFFREQCKAKGHYIWLNTHSQTLVSQLQPQEIIIVNKESGNTIAKQFIDKDLRGLSMDTAWLTNYLGGGLPW